MRGRTLAPVALAGLVALAGQTAHAQSVGDRLGRARERQQQARHGVRTLQSRVSTLEARLARRQTALERTTAEVLAAQRTLRNSSLHLAVARDRLSMRVRAAYEYGPASTLGVLLAAQTPADLASADEFARSVISSDQAAVGAVVNARNQVAERQGVLRGHRALLARQAREVAALLRAIRDKLGEARDAARRADIRVRALERQQAALDAAQRREEARRQQLEQQQQADSQLVNGNGLGATDPHLDAPVPDPGTPAPDPPPFDQSHLLSLLGPTGGRTCTTPPGLRDTGQRISGKATWYGPGFVGKTTASGAIFNPSLFTAAHRTLPFGTFLRVHHGGRCAIVLVNDRGPWIYDRIIDLSEAAGLYLGVSLSDVSADILVPA